MVHKKCGNYGTVAEQRASYLFGKSPKLCGWKIYVICHTSYFASLVLALLLNTSHSFTLLHIICLVSTVLYVCVYVIVDGMLIHPALMCPRTFFLDEAPLGLYCTSPR